MKTTYTFYIDQETAEKAECVFRSRGLSADLAIGMYFQRTAMLGRLPYDPTAPIDGGNAGGRTDSPTVEGYKAITPAMVEHLWDAFRANLSVERAALSVAADISRATGMNEGSAFMYLVILGNMVKGKPNTRSMKIADLAYYLGRIRDDLGEPAYSNAKKSLRESLAYWDEHSPGNFADKVRGLLRAADANTPLIVRTESTPVVHDDEFARLKVGRLADIVVREILESGAVPPENVAKMMEMEYSRKTFHLSFPCLSRECERISGVKRYYTQPLYIAGERYYLCSQWYEGKHRPKLLAWIRAHTDEQSRSALASLASF